MEKNCNCEKLGINLQIQVMRGIFCIMILVYHMTCRYGDIYGHHEFVIDYLQKFSVIALAGFFCMSGYYSEGKTSESGVRFFLRKFSRLYPEYLLAISIIFIVQLTGYLGPERSTTFIQYLLNIPFLHVVLGTGFVDGAHWYVVFSLAIFLYVAGLKQLNIYQLKLFPLLNVFFLLLVALAFRILHAIPLEMQTYVNYYFAYSVGIGLRRYCSVPIYKKYIIAFFFIILLYIVMAFAFIDGICIIITFGILLSAFMQKLKVLSKMRLLKYIGDRSYIIYLLHQNIGFMIINALISVGINNVFLCVVAACFVDICIGITAYKIKTLSTRCIWRVAGVQR